MRDRFRVTPNATGLRYQARPRFAGVTGGSSERPTAVSRARRWCNVRLWSLSGLRERAPRGQLLTLFGKSGRGRLVSPTDPHRSRCCANLSCSLADDARCSRTAAHNLHLRRRCAFDPWRDMAGWDAVAHIQRTITRAPKRGARRVHPRLSLNRNSKCGGRHSEERKQNQRGHGQIPC